MTKTDFLVLNDTCIGASSAFFNKLGLTCKKFTKHVNSVVEDIQDESTLISYEFGAKENDVYRRNEKGAILIKAENQIAHNKKLKELFDQELSEKQKELVASFDKITLPADVLGNLPPNLFDILNGYIFNHTEDEYFNAAMEELKKRS